MIEFFVVSAYIWLSALWLHESYKDERRNVWISIVGLIGLPCLGYVIVLSFKHVITKLL